MRHDAYGWWIEDAWGLDPGLSSAEQLRSQATPSLKGETDARVVIVGGGFTGMWAALELLDEVPPDEIVLIDTFVCGTGPSGRNGGFCDSFVEASPRLIAQFGVERAKGLVGESVANISEIGKWAESIGVDIAFKQAGQLIAATGDGQSVDAEEIVSAVAELGLPSDTCRHLDSPAVGQLCGSPVVRDGLWLRDTATIHPGRLARALRGNLLSRGVRIHELSEVVDVSSRSNGVEVRTASGGRVKALRGILSAGAESIGFRGLRCETTLTSSHIVMTAPAPDLIHKIGWKDGLAVTDARYLVHYFRTTDEGRLLFGWGGGRIGYGPKARKRESLDAAVIDQCIKDLKYIFPSLSGVPIERAWGGPIDASPVHMPAIREFANGWVAAFGYTGNGVGPSRICGRAMADISLGAFPPNGPAAPLVLGSPTRVPPEPLRWLGGNVIRAGIDSVERAGEVGRRPGRVAALAAGLPGRLGYRIGR